MPYNTSAEEITGLNPDGVMLSNGPGNPEDNTYCIEQISKLIGDIPMLEYASDISLPLLQWAVKPRSSDMGTAVQTSP